jgi:hypothetical protein
MIYRPITEERSMISARRMLAAAALILTAGVAPLRAQTTPDPERAASRQVLLALASHLQDGKWAQADSLFAGRGVHILVDTSAYHRWAEYRDKLLKTELARYSGLKVAHTGVESQVRGNVAWVAFRQEISGTTTPASPPRVARGSAVLEKLEGRWTIVHYHISR